MTSDLPDGWLDGWLDVASDTPDDDPLVGARLVLDVDLGSALRAGRPVRVVSTGGAGALAGPLRLAGRAGVDLAGVVTTLRDLDDLPGNARRVVAALDAASDAGLAVPDVAVEVPAASAHAVAATLDVLAERELTLGLCADLPAPALVERIEAALDRETAYRVTTPVDPARALALLAATTAAWDGAGPDEVARLLTGSAVDAEAMRAGRRWLRSCATTDVAGVRAALA